LKQIELALTQIDKDGKKTGAQVGSISDWIVEFERGNVLASEGFADGLAGYQGGESTDDRPTGGT